MKFHPYSGVFDLIEGQAFEDLIQDIKTNGLREKIWVYEDQILDGRNRWLACKRAGVQAATREFRGKDPLGFVISLNRHRRHLSEAQLAFAANRIATMRQGERTDLASREARFSQADAAAQVGASRSSTQRAKKVAEKGSKALQRAAESGEVPLAKAASVVNLPKAEQLAAAKASKPDSDAPARDDSSSAEEEAYLAALEREYGESIEKIMKADDRLAAAHAEVKRQAAEIATLKLSRDGYMNGKAEITRLLQTEQRKTLKLQKEIQRLESEVERLSERVAIREAS